MRLGVILTEEDVARGAKIAYQVRENYKQGARLFLILLFSVSKLNQKVQASGENILSPPYPFFSNVFEISGRSLSVCTGVAGTRFSRGNGNTVSSLPSKTFSFEVPLRPI